MRTGEWRLLFSIQPPFTRRRAVFLMMMVNIIFSSDVKIDLLESYISLLKLHCECTANEKGSCGKTHEFDDKLVKRLQMDPMSQCVHGPRS